MLSLDERLRAALAEDIGRGDATTLATIPASQRATAEFLLKEPGVLSGLEVATRVFALVDPAVSVTWTQGCCSSSIVTWELLRRVAGLAKRSF